MAVAAYVASPASTHLAIVKAVVDAVLSLEGMQDVILARARELHESGGKHEAELRRLGLRERKLRSQIEHLGHAVEHSGGEITSLCVDLFEQPLLVRHAVKEGESLENPDIS